MPVGAGELALCELPCGAERLYGQLRTVTDDNGQSMPVGAGELALCGQPRGAERWGLARVRPVLPVRHVRVPPVRQAR